MARPTNEGEGDNAEVIVVNQTGDEDDDALKEAVDAVVAVVADDDDDGDGYPAFVACGCGLCELLHAIVAANKAVTMATNTMTPPR